MRGLEALLLFLVEVRFFFMIGLEEREILLSWGLVSSSLPYELSSSST